MAFAGVMFAFSVASALATYAEDRPDFTLQSRCCGKVGFTPNGRSVAAVTLDSILMWDVATARELPGFARIARGMTIETIGPEWQLALRPRRGARRPWGITRLGSLDTTEMFLDSASNPTFVPTGSYVATATPGTLRLWNIGSGKAEERIDQFEPQESVVSFEGGTLITGIGSTVRVRRLGSARASGTIRPDILPTNYAAVLSDYSPHFALIPFGGVEIRSTLDAALVARRASRPSAAFTDVAFLPDGGRALLVLSALDSNKDSLYLWRWSENRGDTAAVLSLIAVSDNFDQLSVSPDGRVLATSESNGTIRLWDTSKWSVLRTVFAHRGGADRMYLSPDGSRLLTMGDHFLLSVWRVPTPSGQDAVQSNPPNARP